MKIAKFVTLFFISLLGIMPIAASAAQVATIATFSDCPECPEMVVIPAGNFTMGLVKGIYGAQKPAHSVTFRQSFALGKTEVTQGQWKAIMGNNPSYFNNCGDNCPIENVSWYDAQEFVRKLNEKTGRNYRLPSEAEWEYSCRGGIRQTYCGSENLDSVAWYGANTSPGSGSSESTHPVATKQPNAFGLYDMSGNVSEWVEDSYHDNYRAAPTDGSVWAGGDGGERILRGGSWNNTPDIARPETRIIMDPEYHYYMYGFRVARMLP